MSTAPAQPMAILLVDDDPAWLHGFEVTLTRKAGLSRVLTCQDPRQVAALLDREPIGLVVLDLNMPELSGEEVLAAVTSEHPEVLAIVVSGMDQVETAVRCVKAGAFDYFVKTTEEDRLVGGVLRAVRMAELQRENREVASRILGGPLRHPEAFEAIVTRDRAMHAIFSYVEAVARSPQPLLITGESGVGKELVARAAHALSGRSGPFVAVNVAGLDDAVFADALFGHIRGAFTGADQVRRGMIEEAADGTLLLDEIGDLSTASQVKLLRLLQEGEYFPLGSDRPKRLRARLMVATHHDVAARQAAGTFRRDLYYRLCTHLVRIPPLRERTGDLPLLVDHFLDEAAAALGKKRPTAPRQLIQLLATHAFPGNVRELRALLFNAVSLHTAGVLSTESFQQALGRRDPETIVADRRRSPAIAGDPSGVNPFEVLETLPTFDDALELLLDEALRRSGGNQTVAARLLGVSQPALSKRLKARREHEES
jgi:DNA-binding NtrC family response regulator